MVINEIRGESGLGDRSGSSMSKCSADVNSDLGNGSFGVEMVPLGSKSAMLRMEIDVVEDVHKFDSTDL